MLSIAKLVPSRGLIYGSTPYLSFVPDLTVVFGCTSRWIRRASAALCGRSVQLHSSVQCTKPRCGASALSVCSPADEPTAARCTLYSPSVVFRASSSHPWTASWRNPSVLERKSQIAGSVGSECRRGIFQSSVLLTRILDCQGLVDSLRNTHWT